jgi:hypothetical protein
LILQRDTKSRFCFRRFQNCSLHLHYLLSTPVLWRATRRELNSHDRRSTLSAFAKPSLLQNRPHKAAVCCLDACLGHSSSTSHEQGHGTLPLFAKSRRFLPFLMFGPDRIEPRPWCRAYVPAGASVLLSSYFLFITERFPVV